MTIYYDVSAGRGNYDDNFSIQEIEVLSKNLGCSMTKWKYSNNRSKSSKYPPKVTEWIPTKPSNNSKQNGLTVKIQDHANSQNSTPKRKLNQRNNYNSRRPVKNINDQKLNNSYSYGNINLKLGTKCAPPINEKEIVRHSFSEPTNISKLGIYTQATVDFAPSSLVFFNPVKILGENSLVIAIKHDKFLKKKNFNKTFNNMSSVCLLNQKMITSSSVFELRPCNDASAL